jgi:type II secretory pathway component GspD/PulD (secretin)
MRSHILFSLIISCFWCNQPAFGQTINSEKDGISFLDDRTISIHVDNEDLSSVLRFVSEAGGVNIVAGQDAVGAVSIHLNDVPLSKALDAILGISGLTYYSVGSIVFVTSEENRGNLPATVQDFEVRTFSLNNIDPGEVIATLEELIAPNGKVWVNPANKFVIKAPPATMDLVEKLLAQLDVAPRQVRIKVKFVNVRRDDNLEIGVGFDSLPFSQFGIETATNGFATPLLTDDEGGSVTLPTGFFAGTFQSDFGIFLQALDEISDVEVIASPEILALDGEQAKIQVGDRLGFRVTTTTETSSLESVEFLEVGTVLEVTPRISDDGFVRLEIHPKVSTGSIDSTGLPTESTTEVTTMMNVRHGESVIIGGLLNASRQRVKSQVPFLGDLPWVGKLFGKNRWLDDRSEVVVLITPYIVGMPDSLDMEERVEAVNDRWGEFGEQGLITDGNPFLGDSPTKKFNDWRTEKPEDNGTDEPVEMSALPEEMVTYTVRRGDTVSKLARRYGTSPSTILAVNELSNPNQLTVGQAIYLPLGVVEVPGD